MLKVWILAKRELSSFFDSLMAYIIIITFLAFTGFLTWLAGADIFMRKEADLMVFFSWARITLVFFIPAITMKLFAEEIKTGTIELLLTKDLTERQIVLGKFLACIILVLVTLVFTLPYYVTVSTLGAIDHGATISGFLALMLMSFAYVAIGLWASSITNNQIVAFVLALVTIVIIHFIFDVLASATGGIVSTVFSQLSSSRHIDSLSRGVMDIRDVLFFISITVLGLALAELSIKKR